MFGLGELDTLVALAGAGNRVVGVGGRSVAVWNGAVTDASNDYIGTPGSFLDVALVSGGIFLTNGDYVIEPNDVRYDPLERPDFTAIFSWKTHLIALTSLGIVHRLPGGDYETIEGNGDIPSVGCVTSQGNLWVADGESVSRRSEPL